MIATYSLIFAVAVLLEVLALFYCTIRRLPFGRAFGSVVLVQVGMAGTFIAALYFHAPFFPSPADSVAGFYIAALIALFSVTLAAGALGFYRIFASMRVRAEESRAPLSLMSRIARWFIVGGTVAVIGWLVQDWWIHRNPYEKDGLHLEWTFGGMTSSYPDLDAWADYRGTRIPCPVAFGGIRDPELHFRDYDGDGRRDLVFENDEYKQVVSFTPAHGDSPPAFKVLRNDVHWP